MSKYEYKIQNSRKIVKTDFIDADSIPDAHNKLKEKYEDSIIWIDGIRFPPSVKLRNYSLRLNPRVKRNFDKLRGERTVNNFLKRLMECYEENNIKRR